MKVARTVLNLRCETTDKNKYVPPHVNIFYCLGGITFTCFLVQVASGFAMTFYYRPTVAEAFASVNYLMNDVNFGWIIRSIHRWSASMMVLSMILQCDDLLKNTGKQVLLPCGNKRFTNGSVN